MNFRDAEGLRAALLKAGSGPEEHLPPKPKEERQRFLVKGLEADSVVREFATYEEAELHAEGRARHLGPCHIFEAVTLVELQSETGTVHLTDEEWALAKRGFGGTD